MPSSPSLRRGGDSLVGGLDPVTSFHFGPVERGIGPCDERLDRGQRRAACHTGADRRRNLPAVEHAAGPGAGPVRSPNHQIAAEKAPSR